MRLDPAHSLLSCVFPFALSCPSNSALQRPNRPGSLGSKPPWLWTSSNLTSRICPSGGSPSSHPPLPSPSATRGTGQLRALVAPPQHCRHGGGLEGTAGGQAGGTNWSQSPRGEKEVEGHPQAARTAVSLLYNQTL